MSLPSIGFLQRLSLIVMLGVSAGAVLSWGVLRSRLASLRDVEPHRRLQRLLFWTACPAAAGLLMAAVGLAPSWLHEIGVGHDHCHTPSGHVLELCLLHTGHLPTSSAIGWGLIGLVVGGVGLQWASDLQKLGHAHRTIQRLEDVPRTDASESQPYQRLAVDEPIAATLGLLFPRIVISEGLLETLDASHVDAVLAHESHHADRRHGLLCWSARLLSRLHVPALQSTLLDDIELACEQIADRRAAEQVGGPVPVAEALVEVKQSQLDRLGATMTPPSSMAFDEHRLERRVRDLLETEWRTPNLWPPAVALASGGFVLAAHEPFHRAMEMGLGVFW